MRINKDKLNFIAFDLFDNELDPMCQEARRIVLSGEHGSKYFETVFTSDTSNEEQKEVNEFDHDFSQNLESYLSSYNQ